MLNPITLAQDEIKTDNGKLLIKEFFGFEFFVLQKRTENASLEYDYTCRWKFQFQLCQQRL